MKKDSFYDDRVVIKPWGYEHVVYRDKDKLCVTLLNINYKQKTSLHCHPNKKSGFMLLKGKAAFQLGLKKKNLEIHSSPSKRMIARGLFHQLTSLSKSGLIALEFETPVDKNDLVRFKDVYGREKRNYEGKKHTLKVDSKFIKFKKPSHKIKQEFIFDNVKLNIEIHSNFKKLLSNKKDSIFAILDGAITDHRNIGVVNCGDILRVDDFKILSKVFKIKKNLKIVKLSKIK